METRTGPTGRRRRLALAALLAALAGGAVVVWQQRDRAEPRLNAVVVLVDTLRADRLGAYGNHRPTSPNLDAWAQRGVVLRRVWSQAGCTFPSVNALLTSRAPSRFLGQPGRAMGIPPEVPSLPRLLQAAGYSTAAISSSPVVRSRPNQVNRHGGFGGGFDSFADDCWQQPGRCVNDAATATLPGLAEPFLLYLHYMEPHAPYRPPAEHRRRFKRRRAAKPFILRGDPVPLLDMIYRDGPHLELTGDDRSELQNSYDEEVRYVDRLFGELMGELEGRGLLERTVVVLVADHGEELLDHGGLGHCRDLAHESVLATPMVWWAPGLAPAVREGLASNADLLPTLLDLLGVAAPPGLEGRSLRPLLVAGRPVSQLAFATQSTVQAVTDGRWKLLRDGESGTARLYDLAADPGETRDLVAAHPEVVRRLAEALAGWVRRTTGGDEGGALRDALEAERQLRAVGYL